MKSLFSMRGLNGLLILALPITSIALAGFKLDVATITVVVVSIAIALTFANLERIARFKASFIELEMQKATEKALAAVSDLKQLALALTNPIVALYTLEGDQMMGRRSIPFQTKLDRVKEIKSLLEQFGATKEEIEASCGALNQLLTELHIRQILFLLKLYHRDNPAVQEALKDVEEWSPAPYMTVEQIKEFMRTHNLTAESEIEQRILDYEHYLTTGELRRPTKKRFK